MKDKSAWRFFPLAVALSLLGVIGVNAGFVWWSLVSFPGTVDDHAFDTGNSYNHVLDQAALQQALGWRVAVKADGRRVALTLSDAGGATVPGLVVHAVAAHPVGPPLTTGLDFAASDGAYVATAALPAAGQWDIDVTAIAGGSTYRVTRRLIVP